MEAADDLRRKSLVVGLSALLGFVVMTVLVRTGVVEGLDDAVMDGPFRVTSETPWLRHAALTVQWLFGLWAMTAYTLAAATFLFLKNHRRAALFVIIAMVSTTLATDVLKVIVGRERPVWDAPLTTLSSLSYPSGHSSGIAAAASVVAVITWMLVRRRGLRQLLVGAAVVIALLVGLDRILLGVHHLSDVAGGYLLGVAAVALSLAAFDPRPTSIALLNDALPEVYTPEERTLAVVLNPVKVDDPGGFRSMVESMAATSGYSAVTWYETTIEDIGHGQAHEAAVTGADLVLTCGGDGTVRAVCEELAGTGIPVGVVPAGTGNLLARNLDLPLYLRAAVDVALNGQDRAIDMVEVTGDGMDDATFLVMAGMGFDAAIMEGVNEDIKAKVGWIAYVVSALKSLMFPAVKVEITVDDGEPTTHRARTIVIGNVGYLQGGMPLIPDAEIDDGELDVVLLYPRRFLSWLPLAARILSRRKRTDELVDRFRGRTVTVRASGDTPRQLDGDLIEPGREITATCVHGRLLVRVPR